MRIERVFGVDEGGQATGLLRFGDDLQRDGRLARRLGTENLDDAAARNAADAQRCVEGDRTGGDDGDGHDGLFAAEAHDGALAELLLNLR